MGVIFRGARFHDLEAHRSCFTLWAITAYTIWPLRGNLFHLSNRFREQKLPPPKPKGVMKKTKGRKYFNSNNTKEEKSKLVKGVILLKFTFDERKQ